MFTLLFSSNGKIVIPIRELNINDGCFLIYKNNKKLTLKRIGNLNDTIVYIKVQVNNVPGIKAKVMLKLAEYSELKIVKFEGKREETIMHLIAKLVNNDFLKKLSEDLRRISHVKKCDISVFKPFSQLNY